jgi:hypothetical protein
MRRIVLAVPFLLTACAIGPSLQTRMAAYIGAPEAQLVQALGVPDKQISVDGVDYLAYVRQQAQLEPEMDLSFGAWGGPFWGPYYGGFTDLAVPRDIDVWSCEITFTVKDGKVWNVTFKGNDCN